jgi:hypothetical protein
MKHNDEVYQFLAAIRDMLLSRLLSGEIRIDFNKKVIMGANGK